MSEVKLFRVTGEIHKAKIFGPMKFTKDVEATKREHAVERIYAEMGSHHRSKRHQIKILSVEELERGEVAHGK